MEFLGQQNDDITIRDTMTERGSEAKLIFEKHAKISFTHERKMSTVIYFDLIKYEWLIITKGSEEEIKKQLKEDHR